MTLQDYIHKIDAIAEAINGLSALNITSAYIMASNDLHGIPLDTFLDLCEYYAVDPSGDALPYVYVRIGIASVHVECERVQRLAESKPSTLDRLRAIAANTPAQ